MTIDPLTAGVSGKRGDWHGVIRAGKRVVWACKHSHTNRDIQNQWISRGSSYDEAPVRRSALNCAREFLPQLKGWEISSLMADEERQMCAEQECRRLGA